MEWMLHRLTKAEFTLRSRTVIDFCIVAIISGGVAAFFSSSGYVTLLSDTHSYTQYAVQMVRGQLSEQLAWRTPGYPILLLITGLTITGSVAGVLAVQAAASAAIPAIANSVLQPVNRWIAAVVSGILIISLIPYLYLDIIYPDEIYVFLLLVVTAATCRWLLTNHPQWLYVAIAFCLIAGWFRPVGLILVVPIFGLALLYRRDLLHAAICLALFLAIAIGGPRLERGNLDKSFIGRQAFFDAYMWSDGQHGAFSSGTAAHELRQRLKEFFASNPSRAKLNSLGAASDDADYERYFGRFSGHPDAQVAAIFARPNVLYFWVISTLSFEEWSGGDLMLLHLTLRHYWNHPLQPVRSTFWTYLALTWGPAWYFHYDNFGLDAMQRDPPIFLPLVKNWGADVVPERDYITSLRVFANRALPIPPWALRVRQAFAAEYSILQPTSYVLMIVGVLGFLWIPGRVRTTALVVFAIHLTNVLVIALLIDPWYRYQAQSVPLAITGAGIGIYRLITLLPARRAAVGDLQPIHTSAKT